ncbi:MAG TPA: hypothetical protein VLH16_03090 [Bacteroidales bacterium]|nr:hypothetical protein [Bacteroidales bacterium]
MSDNNYDQGVFNASGVIFFLYKWRKTLMIIVGASFIISFVVSSPLFIVPKYRSSVIMYPVATSSISTSLLTERSTQRYDLLELGQDSQTEQMLQLLKSSRMRNRVIERFNLENHYEIDPGKRYRMTRLINEYNSNINFRRTEYQAVQINVFDRDPQMAADIANYIAEMVDSVRIEMQRQVAQEGHRIVKTEYERMLAMVKEKEDSLRQLRERGVHEYESQSEMLNQQLAIEIARNNQQAIRALEERLSLVASYGGAYVSLRDQLVHDIENLSILKIRYNEARVDAEQHLPSKFIVESAVKAERKSYPIRSLIIVVSVLGTLLVSVFIITFFENFRKFSQLANIRIEKKHIIPQPPGTLDSALNQNIQYTQSGKEHRHGKIL